MNGVRSVGKSRLEGVVAGLLRTELLRRLGARVAAATMLLAPTAYAPAAPATLATAYTVEDARYRPSSYGVKDRLYVHIPPFVKVHRAPLHVFGPRLYGLAVPSTGDVWVREDLTGDAYLEVLAHEVGHVLYPNLSEQANRDRIRSRFGDRGRIHQRLGQA